MPRLREDIRGWFKIRLEQAHKWPNHNLLIGKLKWSAFTRERDSHEETAKKTKSFRIWLYKYIPVNRTYRNDHHLVIVIELVLWYTLLNVKSLQQVGLPKHTNPCFRCITPPPPLSLFAIFPELLYSTGSPTTSIVFPKKCKRILDAWWIKMINTPYGAVDV